MSDICRDCSRVLNAKELEYYESWCERCMETQDYNPPEVTCKWIEYPKDAPKIDNPDIEIEVEYDGGSTRITTVRNANWNMVDRFRFTDKA